MLRPAVDVGSIRPEGFDDFIGYEAEKDSLRDSILALGKDIEVARKMDEQMGLPYWDAAYSVSSDNILLVGLPGFGKTTLAKIYARARAAAAMEQGWPMWRVGEMDEGVEVWDGGIPDRIFRWTVIEGRTLRDEETLDGYLCHIQAYGTLIIDEFQQVDKKAMRTMYSLLHEGEWYSHINGKTMKKWGFNIVATTTDESEIPDALVSRFLTQVRLNSYTESDLSRISLDACAKMGLIGDDDVIRLLVLRGRGTPRTIISILSKARTILRVAGDSCVLTPDVVRKASVQMGCGPLGLTRGDVRVMLFLRSAKEGGRRGAVGANTLATVAGYGSVPNYKKAEAFLVSNMYVIPSSGGSVLTKEGERALIEAENDPDFRFIDPSQR